MGVPANCGARGGLSICTHVRTAGLKFQQFFKVLSMSERNLQEQIRTRARSVCVSLLKTHTHNIKWGRSEMLRSAGVIQRKQQQKDRLETGPLLYYTQQHRGGLIRAHVQERST